MNGHDTFSARSTACRETTVDAVAAPGATLDEIDLFVYHQANSRILTAVGEASWASIPSASSTTSPTRQHLGGDDPARAGGRARAGAA